jgi:hypothetical protein
MAGLTQAARDALLREAPIIEAALRRIGEVLDETAHECSGCHLMVKRSFSDAQLAENVRSMIGRLRRWSGATDRSVHPRTPGGSRLRLRRRSCVPSLVPVIADLGDNLFVSSHDVCDERFLTFETCVHIWRSDRPSNTCNAIRTSTTRPTDLVVDYKEGESLHRASVSLEGLMRYLGGLAPTLIHCQSCQTRGPTFAVIGKVARGCPLPQAIDHVLAVVRAAGQPSPVLHENTLDEIRAEVRRLAGG